MSIVVNWKSKILSVIQKRHKDEVFHAFQDTHNGLVAIKNVVEDLKINSTTPFGVIDGNNKNFQMKSEPAFIVVNGIGITKTMINGVDFTWKNGWITFLGQTPPAGATIRGFHV